MDKYSEQLLDDHQNHEICIRKNMNILRTVINIQIWFIAKGSES